MRNTKVYSILEQFDKYEQNRCRKFLQSPYFNRDQIIVRLFDLLVKDINTEKKDCVDKETLWKNLNTSDVFDDVRFRKYFSDLTKLTEDFLCQQVYEKNMLQKSAYLIQGVAEKKIEKLRSSSIRFAHKQLDDYHLKSASYYYYRYLIENNHHYLVAYETKRDEKVNFEGISDNLDYFFLSEKLRILSEVLSRQSVASHKYNINLQDELINYVSLNINKYNSIPPISLYYQICMTYLEPEKDDHYFALKDLLNKYAHLFPAEEAIEQLYNSAQNYCIRKINQGNQLFVKELFILYKDLIEKEIITAHGMLTPWYFRNIVTIGLRVGETEWTEKFILNYKEKLSEEMRENAVSFNLSQVYFYQKKYDKVIELLRTVEYEDFTYNLNSKATLLSSYYELDEVEPLYSLFESFRTFLNRHKDLPPARKQLYTNLIRFTKKLTSIRHSDTKAVQKLKQELELTKNVASHAWLMEKIAELE